MATHGITSKTPERQVFGPGVWIRNYDRTKSVNEQKINIMGATTGGTIARVVQTFEADRPDGGRGDFKDMNHLVEDWAEAETTMKEIDLDTLLDMLPGAAVAYSGGVATISRARDLQSADYLNNVSFICDHAAANGAVGFILYNALAMDNLEVTAPEKTTAAGLAVKLKAFYDADNADTAPWNWLFPDDSVVS